MMMRHSSERYPSTRFFAVLFATLLLCAASSSFANKMTTQNQYVQGEVDDAGKVVWYVFEPGGRYPISYNPSNSESFLTVQIDGKYYTNSDIGPQLPRPADFNLNGFSPVNTRLLSVARDGKDTIRTTWKIGSLDLIQDIYPFEFEKSGQIVIRVRVQNHGNVPASVAAQYLLDIDVDNDKAKVLTRWGYSPNWNQYQDPPAPPTNSVPWFFMGFKDPLPGGAGGKSSTGYLDKREEGLIKPWRVTIGDWNDLVNWTWGPPTPIPNQEYKDDAILMEWPAAGIPPANSNGTPGVGELLRTSYGSGEFEICTGQLMTISFYPHRLKCRGSAAYDPNPFELESLVFNVNESITASAVKVNLHVTDPLTILGPGTPRNGGKDDEQAPASGAIMPLGVTDLTWQLQASIVKNCSQDLDANLSLTATAQGINPPVMNECEMPIKIECCDQDTIAPRFLRFQGSLLDSSFHVHDSLTTDKGLKDITWNVSAGLPGNFTITVTPPKPIVACPKSDYLVDVQQIDSTQGGCIDFAFSDCDGNVSYRTICFSAHPRPNQPDTARPVIKQIGWYHWPTINNLLDSTKRCSAQLDTFLVTDNAAADRGLQKVSVLGTPTNMTFFMLPFTVGTGAAGFSVAVVDSMLDGAIDVVAQDVAGHTDTAHITYCTIPDTLAPKIDYSALSPTYSWHVVVTDSQAWDRGLANVFLYGLVNVNVVPMPTAALVNGKHIFEFDVTIIDPAKNAGLCDSAVDLAGNSTQKYGNCLFYKGQTDVMKPNIAVTPALNTNPKSIQVAIDDIHPNFDYDTGIDSVWFTGVYNMTLTYGSQTYVDAVGGPHTPFPAIHNTNVGGLHPFSSTVPVFVLTVTDTASVDSLACVTIHAIDGRQVRDGDGVNETVVQWCYPITLDSLAPLMVGAAPDRTHIRLHISDERLKDRGLRQLSMRSNLNFDDLPGTTPGILQYDGDSATDVTLTVTQPGKSAVTTVEALDMFGSKLSSPSDRLAHTASANLWIYAQNLRMKASRLITQSGDFDIAVYLDSTDAIPLLQKQIGEYKFDFHLTGGDLIDFLQPITAGTLSNGWTVTATPGAARSYSIHGSAVPVGSVLSGTAGATYYGASSVQPLVYLRFHGDSSEYSSLTSIVIDGESGAEVEYNGGGMQRLNGQNSIVDIPKPYGGVNGGNITLKGFCSPVVGSGMKPSVIALERVTPSPATKGSDPHIASEYTIPESENGATHVTIELWNMLGQKVATLIDQEQAPGRYRLEVPTQGLAEGSYIIRLSAQNVVLSRRAVIR